MLLIVLVFAGVFTVTALLLTAGSSGKAELVKQTLSRLDVVLSTTGDRMKEELVDVRKKEVLSSIPFLNRLLLQLEATARLRRLLYQADVNWTPAKLLLSSLVLWVAAWHLISLRIDAFLPAMALALAPATIPFAYVLVKRSKQFQKFEEGLPPALDLMVSGLRSGHSIVSSIGLVAREAADPIGREFRVCFEEQNYGLELRAALENLAVRVPLQDLRIIMTAILVQKETGGNLAEVLEKCAHIIRERFRLKREIRVRTAQGRFTGWILSLLPPVLGLFLYFLHPDFVSILWKRPAGVRMLYTSAVMTTIGALFIRKIVRIRV